MKSGKSRPRSNHSEHLAVPIDELGRKEATEEMEHATTQARLTMRIVLTSIVVVLIFGFGLTLAMNRKLTEIYTESEEK